MAEHAATHGLPSVSVILHGGEPLLAGPARLRKVCEELGTALNGIAELDLRIHTNGVQLSPRYLDLFDEFDVRVGISLDGDRTANDRHRRYADGRTSHPLVLRAIELLRQDRYRHLDLGLLCTVDVRNDPVAVFDALADLEPPLIDFLLPHATWDDPPPRPDGSRTAYADWLLTIFDRWQERGRPVPVRFFSSILSSLGGGPSLTESLGLAPTDLVVVETDGQLEQVDSLKSAYEGAAATGFDVFTHSFDDVAAHPGVRARQSGLAGVSDQCRSCPVVRSCGGGLYTHRYRSANDFDNPSVYCSDLEALVRGIEERTASATVSRAVSETDELVAEQNDLARTLLAGLHASLDGRAGELWSEAWESTAALDASDEGSGGLDRVLTHPYTRTWLEEALGGLRSGADGAVGAALRFPSYVAAAAVRSGLDMTVRATFTDGRLYLPTLGSLTVGGPGDRGTVQVRNTGEGSFVVRSADGREWRIGPRAPQEPHWREVRQVLVAGIWRVALDDLDPYRDCFGAPVSPRLTPAETERWAARLGEAWALLLDAAPKPAAAAMAGLTTLTPLADGIATAGRHGFGALGIGLGTPGASGADAARELAIEVLRAYRRAEFRALSDVVDLYALDGAWEHRTPWHDGPVPFSSLLKGTYERVALGLIDQDLVRGVPQALDRLETAAELTIHGKRLLAELRKEISGQVGGDSLPPDRSMRVPERTVR